MSVITATINKHFRVRVTLRHDVTQGQGEGEQGRRGQGENEGRTRRVGNYRT